ncbi:unnamed protein product [Rhizoctonia solani]|uniref:Uncharacterized protein n=1 Tax=Rhizoctonia solani TaxID=456999 RepID=A0A8H3A478_9AGAM|nr:unnamed protein product [Rhizoctonia solani]CAE6465061.1 unnamed protein product [Rhizoctonia solani]
MQTLAQNGMVYFAALVVLMVLACIGGTIETVKIASNASGVLSAISSVVCSRMIFSLYRITRKERLEDLTTPPTSGDTNGSMVPRFAIPMQSLVSTSISCN